MSGEAAFVDTDVLVYAFESGESPRNRRSRDLLRGLMESGKLRTNTQVLQELYVMMTRKLQTRANPVDVLAIMEDLSKWQVVATNFTLVREGCLLSQTATTPSGMLSSWPPLSGAWRAASIPSI